MLLEQYLNSNGISLKQFQNNIGISEISLKKTNKQSMEKWSIEFIECIARCVNKDKYIVIRELELMKNDHLKLISRENEIGRYGLENRRYIGNKSKLMQWISELISDNTEGEIFFDVFAGTGVVTKNLLNNYSKFILNDFLYSNNLIYKAFFGKENYCLMKLYDIKEEYQSISDFTDDDYFQKNYGGKFFSLNDARLIGEIRNRIEQNKFINEREKAILISSLLYSMDKVANTVGHYDAYRKNNKINDRFKFELINPLNTSDKDIEIYREDANVVVKKVSADIAFIDPPYNSRQYSRFYHLLEVTAKWNKPKLEGVAMKPPVENISEFCKVEAPKAFDDLVKSLNVKYIVVTYNNTYKSKSKSSKNKITHEQIINSLNSVGETKVFDKPFKFFNAGNTDLDDHKEFVFITKVKR